MKSSEMPIEINDSLSLSEEQVFNLLGIPWSLLSKKAFEWMLAHPIPMTPPTTVTSVSKVSGATEERTRKALGISRTELADWAAALGWKRTFSQERDRRAGQGANAQKRGQVTRQMRKELQAAIEAATHGDDK